MKKFLILFFLVPAFAIAQKDSTHSEFNRIEVPDTDVSLILHKDFQYSGDAPVYVNPKNATSVVITEIDASVFKFDEAMTDDFWESQELEFVSREEIKEKGKEGFLYTVLFEVKDIKFERLIYIKGDENHMIRVMANYPVMIRTLVKRIMRYSLLSSEMSDD